MMSKIKLYRYALSGHSHRVEAFLSMLKLSAEIIDVDLASGAHKQSDFLRKNIFGQVPVLDDGDTTLADSNAILTYLAKKYDQNRTWLPVDATDAAAVQRFLSVAAGPIAYGPAAARRATVFGAKQEHSKAIKTAHAVLSVMETHLQDRKWLATDKPTIADVANYTYIAHAPEGNVSLQMYPNVNAWLKRIEALPGFVPMQSTAVGLAK